jgi:DNA-binding response OmpR family regulator
LYGRRRFAAIDRDIDGSIGHDYSPSPQSAPISTAAMSATKTAPDFSAKRTAPKIRGQMPARIKVLYVTTLHRTGGWLAEAFRSDSATEVLLVETVGVTAGLSHLRDEVFDAVLVNHEPGVLDALELVEGMRGGGNDEPAIVLGTAPSSQMAALAYEVGADAYCCVAETTTRSLLWTFARAIERCQLVREHRRLVQNEQQRLAHEHQEAEHLLGEQRALIAELEKIRIGNSAYELTEGEPLAGHELGGGAVEGTGDFERGGEPPGSPSANAKSHACDLPERLVTHYREMLRAYVVMGAGNLAEEMVRLAAMLTEADVSAQRTMQLHVQVLEELVGSLGNRSARHVMTRADLLVLEIMAHLADGYRRRYHEDCRPAEQPGLPGF